MSVRIAIVSGVAALTLSASASAQSVEVYTMGPGADVFSRFGHAALCVRDDETPDGRCYNYGTTDFSTPGPLTWAVLRGRARFWVSVAPLQRMLDWYGAMGEDRTVWRQRVALTPEQFEALRARLRDDLRPGQREYVYHHFRDNCTTRVRDHLDAVTLGALRGAVDRPHDRTWRAMVLDGFGDSAGLLVAGELLLARPLDATPTRWEAMFLPAVMREEVTARLGARPEAVHVRRQPVSEKRLGAGRVALAMLAAVVGALAWWCRGRGGARVAQALCGVVAGVPAVLVWGLSLASTLPELRDNDLRAVLLPTDVLLGALRGRALERYARARVAMAVVASALHALGVTPQPMYASSSLVVAAMLPWTLPVAPR